MPGESVPLEATVQMGHYAIPRHLGDDRCRRHVKGPRVSTRQLDPPGALDRRAPIGKRKPTIEEEDIGADPEALVGSPRGETTGNDDPHPIDLRCRCVAYRPTGPFDDPFEGGLAATRRETLRVVEALEGFEERVREKRIRGRSKINMHTPDGDGAGQCPSPRLIKADEPQGRPRGCPSPRHGEVVLGRGSGNDRIVQPQLLEVLTVESSAERKIEGEELLGA